MQMHGTAAESPNGCKGVHPCLMQPAPQSPHEGNALCPATDISHKLAQDSLNSDLCCSRSSFVSITYSHTCTALCQSPVVHFPLVGPTEDYHYYLTQMDSMSWRGPSWCTSFRCLRSPVGWLSWSTRSKYSSTVITKASNCVSYSGKKAKFSPTLPSLKTCHAGTRYIRPGNQFARTVRQFSDRLHSCHLTSPPTLIEASPHIPRSNKCA